MENALLCAKTVFFLQFFFFDIEQPDGESAHETNITKNDGYSSQCGNVNAEFSNDGAYESIVSENYEAGMVTQNDLSTEGENTYSQFIPTASNRNQGIGELIWLFYLYR